MPTLRPSASTAPSASQASSRMPRPRRAAIASSSGIAAGKPKMWTGRMPALRSPTAASTAAGSRLSVAGSTSQKTGRAPS